MHGYSLYPCAHSLKYCYITNIWKIINERRTRLRLIARKATRILVIYKISTSKQIVLPAWFERAISSSLIWDLNSNHWQLRELWSIHLDVLQTLMDRNVWNGLMLDLLLIQQNDQIRRKLEEFWAGFRGISRSGALTRKAASSGNHAEFEVSNVTILPMTLPLPRKIKALL